MKKPSPLALNLITLRPLLDTSLATPRGAGIRSTNYLCDIERPTSAACTTQSR